MGAMGSWRVVKAVGIGVGVREGESERHTSDEDNFLRRHGEISLYYIFSFM